jgi:acyl-CoA thioesterase FadM
MSRITIDLPEVFPFATELDVRIGDVNYGGHLGNDTLLAIIHEARLRYLKEMGWSELNICGSSLIMTDSAIVYTSEAFHGDRLRVEVAIGEANKYGFDFFFRVLNTTTKKEVAHAKTGVVFFNYETRKVQRVPADFSAIFPIITPGGKA